jgi:hypothetical protein
MGERIEVRQAPGLSGLQPGEAEAVVIAECQQIIETVRRRGKVPATQN